jgi:hypothetical protein
VTTSARLRLVPRDEAKAKPKKDGKPREGSYSRNMLDALLEGERFTGPEAYMKWGVWSVSSLMNNLRQQGWQVDSQRDSETGRAVYYIVRKRQLKGRAYYRDFKLGV